MRKNVYLLALSDEEDEKVNEKYCESVHQESLMEIKSEIQKNNRGRAGSGNYRDRFCPMLHWKTEFKMLS